MRRLFLCLPLCFVLIPDSSSREPQAGPQAFPEVADRGQPLPGSADMEQLARTDPIAFLEDCIRRYDREVKGYYATLRKRERIGGQLQPTEVFDVAFREEPFSVRMKWREGTKRAAATLYVKGENGEQALVLPAGAFAVFGMVKRDPYGPDAKKESRYPLPEFGIKVGMQRTLASWQRARADNALHIKYLGQKRVKEVGDRLCYVLERTGYRQVEEDGISGLTVMIDAETWLQVGSVITGPKGLVAEYFFQDVRLNPHFPPDTFTRAGLKK
jgi:hypothetical protein